MWIRSDTIGYAVQESKYYVYVDTYRMVSIMVSIPQYCNTGLLAWKSRKGGA